MHFQGLSESALKPYMYLGANITFARPAQQQQQLDDSMAAAAALDRKGITADRAKVMRASETKEGEL